MILKRIAFAAVATMTITGVASAPASAADILPLPVVAPPPVMVPAPDWGGFYAGVLTDIQFVSLGGPFVPWVGIGARAGYNFDTGRLVLGIETTVEWSASLPLPPAFTALEFSAVGRAGVVIADGKGLVFAAAGGGLLRNLTFGINAGFWTVGGGLEVMVSDSMSLRTDYRLQRFPAFPGIVSHNFSAGLSFYFGR